MTQPPHRMSAAKVRRLMATYEKARDLVNIGAYVGGSDPEIDAALAALPALMEFLQQGVEFAPFEDTLRMMDAVSSAADNPHAA